MPIENELKFVIKKQTRITCPSWWIEQSYIVSDHNVTVRIRRSMFDDGPDRCFFTTKIFKDEKCYEFEQGISLIEYLELRKDSFAPLKKRRHSFTIGQEHWDVDFFFDTNNELYFAMAEVEMPEEQKEVDYIPRELNGNILYRVEKNDPRFSNARLGSVGHAESLLGHILNDTLQKFP